MVWGSMKNSGEGGSQAQADRQADRHRQTGHRQTGRQAGAGIQAGTGIWIDVMRSWHCLGPGSLMKCAFSVGPWDCNRG